MLTIAGISGSGKSTVCQQLKMSFLENNPDESFDILSFEFEMLTTDQMSRAFSARLQKTTQELYSGSEEPLTDEDIDQIEEAAKEAASLPIFYVDTVGNVDEVIKTVWEFTRDRGLIENNRGLVISIDHALLVEGKGYSESQEKAVIDQLCKALIKLKINYAAVGGRIIIILVSQLNRDIESSERKSNKNLHYPTKNDIFGASSIYHASDYLMVTHKPANLDGIGEYYGPEQKKWGFPKGFPIKNPHDPEQAMIYWHVIKNRFGPLRILAMGDNFKFSQVTEVKL